MNRKEIVLIMLGVLALGFCPIEHAKGEQYHSVEAAHDIFPSDERLAVQFDTTGYIPPDSQFFANHACLDSTITVDTLKRRFHVYGIATESGFDSACAELLSDSTVNRCVPVYVASADSALLYVTDRVDVKFRSDLSWDSATAILENHCLTFADSSNYRHNHWAAALHDSVRTSPLPYANALDTVEEVLWSTPSMAVELHLASGPLDEYYVHQYYLKNTAAGTVDIDIEPVWDMTLKTPNLRIAVIDDGFDHSEESYHHPDLPVSRCFSPWDPVLGVGYADPRGITHSHGMAVAGILGAEHNATGIAGVFGSCEIVPILNTTETGDRAEVRDLAEAFEHANQVGRAKVIVNAWYVDGTQPIEPLQDAIRRVSDCSYETPGESYAGVPPPRIGSVVLFAAGNTADDEYEPSSEIPFPANMSEVITVGAVDSLGGFWDYCCYGDDMDIVAPSGADGEGGFYEPGNVWTVDRVEGLGYNPILAEDDETSDENYTSTFGGTSAAVPQVAGVAGLLMARYSEFDTCAPHIEVRDVLCFTAVDLGDEGWDQKYGWGLVSARRALVAVTRGDLNHDGYIGVIDVVLAVNEVFRNMGPQGLHPGLADVTCDTVVDVFDVVALVNTAFRNYPNPDICYVLDGYPGQ